MIPIDFVINLVVAGFHQMGAHHVSFGGVSSHLAFVETKHWAVTIVQKGYGHCQVVR